jgi:predicted phosphoadenosine phosphosulfate sulfurtransferase
MFEEFTPAIGEWFGKGELCASFIGIRTMESLNRYRSLALIENEKFKGKSWTTCVKQNLWNVYPIYDWDVEDIWAYHGKTGKPYNKLYDRMYQSGMTLSQMRIDEPFGDTQRKGLWLYQIIEPKLWAKMCARVAGANVGSIYADEKGNVLGNKSITLPKGHTWESFVKFLLHTMPNKTSLHYGNKIAVYLHWYQRHGYEGGIPDCIEGDLGSHDIPSWRRICKVVLRNDYWCKGLNFSPTKSHAYEKYLSMMKKRRENWKI